MGDYVGRWDCRACGTKGIWGIQRHCPNCGADTTGKWYLPEGEPAITAEEVLRIVRQGPNWQCRSCRSDNYGDSKFCTECGAEKDKSLTRKTIEHGTGEVPRNSAEADDTLDESGSPPESDSSDSEPSAGASPGHRTSRLPSGRLSTNPGNLSWLLAMVMVAGVVWLGIYLVTRTHEAIATVDHFEWHRTIFVDRYATVREGDWLIPSRGRYVSQEQRIYRYDRVLDRYETRTRQVPSGSETYVCGHTNNGNGTFSDRYCSRTTYKSESYQEAVYRQEPVYRTYYHYDIDKWGSHRTVATSGRNRTEPVPYWGQLVLECANQERLGCEREAGRQEEYVVVFQWYEKEKPREHRLKESRANWDSYQPDLEYTLTFNGLGRLVNDPLHPEEEK